MLRFFSSLLGAAHGHAEAPSEVSGEGVVAAAAPRQVRRQVGRGASGSPRLGMGGAAVGGAKVRLHDRNAA